MGKERIDMKTAAKVAVELVGRKVEREKGEGEEEKEKEESKYPDSAAFRDFRLPLLLVSAILQRSTQCHLLVP